jgi:hypothetical protein
MHYDDDVQPRPLDRFVAWAWAKTFRPRQAAVEPTETHSLEEAFDLEQDDIDEGPERKAA